MNYWRQAFHQIACTSISGIRARPEAAGTPLPGTTRCSIVRSITWICTGAQSCAFIGSNNMTSFALTGLNGEAAVMLEGQRVPPSLINCVSISPPPKTSLLCPLQA